MQPDAWDKMKTAIRAAKGGDGRYVGKNGGQTFDQMAAVASSIPSATKIDGEAIRDLLRRQGGGVICYGSEVRSVLAGQDIPLVDVLERAGWWPDFRLGAGMSPMGLVAEGLRLVGLGDATISPGGSGRRILVELP